MTLTVHTARITYAGADRLDVTRKSGDSTFAPSWPLVGPMIRARKSDPHWLRLWPEYVTSYTAEMRVSYRENRAGWDALLARDEVTLVCYCTDPMHCHRTVLAGILGKLGAAVKGERPLDPKKVLQLMLAAAEHDQTAEEAETELRADGVDVDAFLDGVAKAIRQV